MLLSLLSLSAFAHPPVHVVLSQPTRLSSLQPVGTQAGSNGGLAANTVAYELFWAPYDMAAEAICFASAGGAYSGAHHLAAYGVGTDGRPAALLGYSEPITISSSAAVYCATFADPIEWNVVDTAAFAGGVLALAKDEAVWLSFVRESGTGAAYYRTLYAPTALSLGASCPGCTPVRYLSSAGWTGWTDPAPTCTDASGGEPVLVSLQVAP